jgi:hypothetical protein
VDVLERAYNDAAVVAAFLRDELAIRFGVILRKVWGGSRTWPVPERNPF